MNNLSEKELLYLAKNRDSRAIEELILRYKWLVRKIARRYYLVSGGDTDDLVQEGTIAFFSAILEFNEAKKVSFSTFAVACITNKLRDILRSTTRDKHRANSDAMNFSADGDDAEMALLNVPDNNDPLSVYIDTEALNELQKLVEDSATAEQKAILSLYLDGFSYKEISEKLNISNKKVDNALSTLKTKIKNKLQKLQA